MSFNRSIGYMGLKKQSARGTAASAGAFKFPVYSGGILPKRNISSEQLSTSSRNEGASFLDSIDTPVEFETRLYVGSAIALFHAAMGGISSTGTGDPYSHSLSTSSLPYYTFFESMGASDAELYSAQDVKCNDLEVTWEGPAALKAKFSGLGSTFDLTQADWDSSAVDETDGDGYFFPVGGTFWWDAVGTGTADFVCKSGGLKISNNLEAVKSAATITPYDHDEGKISVVFSLEIAVTDSNLSDWREIMTGSTTGSTPSGEVPTGKVNLVFQEAGAGTHTLTLTASAVEWDIKPIDIDASGGPTTYSVEGKAIYNTTESDALDVTITTGSSGGAYAA